MCTTNPTYTQRTTCNLTLGLISMAAAAFLACPCQVFGAAKTWSGAGTDDYWSTGANWGGTAPANGDTLTFSGTTRQNNTNDIADLLIGAVTFSTAGWTIASTNPITKTNNFTLNTTGTNIWAADTILVDNSSSTGVHLVTSDFNRQLTIAGVLSGSGGFWKTAGANGKGNLFLLCPTNTFTGTIALGTGVSLATQFAPKGSPSSFGAGTGAITIGSTASGYGTYFSFVGTSSNFTDRAVYLQERAGTTLFFYNNSPNNSSLWFDGVITCYSYLQAGGIYLGGTSTGTTTINSGLAQHGGTSYSDTSLSVNGPGTYVVNGPIYLTGSLTVSSGGLLVLGPNVFSVSNPQITVQSGGVLNVDQIAGGFPLGPVASQTLTAGYTTSNTFPSDIVGSLSLGYYGQINVSGPANAGTLNISSNLSLAQSYSGGRILMDLSDQPVLGDGTNDLILVGGDLDLSSQATLSINAYKGTLATGVPYTVIQYNGDFTGDPANLIVPPPARSLTAAASVDSGSKRVQVTFSLSGNAPGNLTWQGTYGPDWDSATTQSWLNHGTNDVFMQGDAVTFNDDSNPTFTSVNLVGPLFPSGITVNTTNDFSFSGNGSLGGGSTMTLAKEGTGSLTISTANSEAGNTVISAGTIVAGNNSALGSSTVTLGDSGTGTNDVALLLANSASIPNPIVLSTNGTGRAILGRLSGGGTAYNGPIQLGRSLIVTNSGLGTASTLLCDLNGNISGQGDLTFIGGGYYRLQAVNTFSGNLDLQDTGIVMQVNGGAAVPDTANVYVATNSTLVVFGNETINGLNGAGIIRSVLYSYTVSVGGAGGSGLFSGTMTNDNSQGTAVSVLSLRKVGAGTQVLTGDNSGSTGSTTVAGGVLAINNAVGSGTPWGRSRCRRAVSWPAMARSALPRTTSP